MVGGSTSDFFQFIDAQNNAIAAREASTKPRGDASGVGVDRIQIQQDAKRREKAGGELRARPRSRNRPNTSRVIRGYMENPGAE